MSVFRVYIFVLMLFHRQKIIKEKAVPKIEGYMFEEHELVRASATECMCNLVLSTEVRQTFMYDCMAQICLKDEVKALDVWCVLRCRSCIWPQGTIA